MATTFETETRPGTDDGRVRPPKRRLRRGLAGGLIAVVMASGAAAGVALMDDGTAVEPARPATPALSDADRALLNRFADADSGAGGELSDADRALVARFADR